MEQEKFYLGTQHDVINIEKDKDGDIDYLQLCYAHEFKNEDDLLRYIIGSRIENDGQIGRTITQILNIITDECDAIIFDESEYEVKEKEFLEKRDLIKFMRNALSNMK
jgi:hypothetical protein